MRGRGVLLAGLSATLVAACASGPPVTALPVSGGSVTIAAPQGHCIDRGSVSDRARGTFVILGSCAALSASEREPAIPAVLTALVSDSLPGAAAPRPAELERFLRSRSGRAGLARDGNPASIRILQSQTRGDVLYLKLRDNSPETDTALTGDQWRAFFSQNGRVIVLSSRSLAARPVSSDNLLAVLRDFVEATRAANVRPA